MSFLLFTPAWLRNPQNQTSMRRCRTPQLLSYHLYVPRVLVYTDERKLLLFHYQHIMSLLIIGRAARKAHIQIGHDCYYYDEKLDIYPMAVGENRAIES